MLRCLATTWAHECGLYGERWSSALAEASASRAAPSRSRIFVWTVQGARPTDPAACQAAFALVDPRDIFWRLPVVCPCGRRLSLERNESTTTTTSRRYPLRYGAVRGPGGATGSGSPSGTGRLRGDAVVHLSLIHI